MSTQMLRSPEKDIGRYMLQRLGEPSLQGGAGMALNQVRSEELTQHEMGLERVVVQRPDGPGTRGLDSRVLRLSVAVVPEVQEQVSRLKLFRNGILTYETEALQVQIAQGLADDVWAVFSDVVSFCPIPEIWAQDTSKDWLAEEAELWKRALPELRAKTVGRDWGERTLAQVPFDRALLSDQDFVPDQLVALGSLEVDPSSMLWNQPPGAVPERLMVHYLRRPFISLSRDRSRPGVHHVVTVETSGAPATIAEWRRPAPAFLRNRAAIEHVQRDTEKRGCLLGPWAKIVAKLEGLTEG